MVIHAVVEGAREWQPGKGDIGVTNFPIYADGIEGKVADLDSELVSRSGKRSARQQNAT